RSHDLSRDRLARPRANNLQTKPKRATSRRRAGYREKFPTPALPALTTPGAQATHRLPTTPCEPAARCARRWQNVAQPRFFQPLERAGMLPAHRGLLPQRAEISTIRSQRLDALT